MPSGVTADRVLALRPGMAYHDVIETIGPPLEMESEMPTHTEGAVPVVHRMVQTTDPTGPYVVLTYSRRVPWAVTYPMFWITLKAGHVTDIYVKHYYGWGIESDGIYGYAQGRTPWGGGVALRQEFERSKWNSPTAR